MEPKISQFTLFVLLSSSSLPCSQHFSCCTLRPSSGDWNFEQRPKCFECGGEDADSSLNNVNNHNTSSQRHRQNISRCIFCLFLVLFFFYILQLIRWLMIQCHVKFKTFGFEKMIEFWMHKTLMFLYYNFFFFFFFVTIFDRFHWLKYWLW